MKKCKLGDLFKIQQGYAFKSEKYIEQGEFLLCTLGNIGEDNRFKYVDVKKRCYYPDEFPHEYILKEDDLIIPLTEQVIGLFGNSAFVPKTEGYKFVLNQRVGKIIPKEGEADKYYLHYLLATNIVRKQIEATASATKQRNTSPDKMYDVDVWIHDYPEQKVIGEHLYNLERKYNNNVAINEELHELAKKIFDFWFLQYDYPDEQGKPYKISGGEMIWNDEIENYIPNRKGWKVGNLYDIADFINGLACQKYRPKDGEDELPVIKITEMHEGITETTETVSVNIPEKYKIQNGDILFSWSASLETMLWYGGEGGLNQHIFKVIPKQGYKYYVYMHLNAYIRNLVKIAESRKTTMGHITTSHLKQSKIVIPPMDLMQKYDEAVEKIFTLILKNSEENIELKSIEKYLLPIAMNGQLTIK